MYIGAASRVLSGIFWGIVFECLRCNLVRLAFLVFLRVLLCVIIIDPSYGGLPATCQTVVSLYSPC